MSFNAIRENKILAKISEFSVCWNPRYNNNNNDIAWIRRRAIWSLGSGGIKQLNEVNSQLFNLTSSQDFFSLLSLLKCPLHYPRYNRIRLFTPNLPIFHTISKIILSDHVL